MAQKYKSPLTEVAGSAVLGSADFVGEIKKRSVDGKKVNRDLPAIRALSSKPTMTDIKKAVEKAVDRVIKVKAKY